MQAVFLASEVVLLAIPPAERADSEKLQLVRHSRETIGGGNPQIDFPQGALFNFNHLRALCANQVVVMPVIPLANQFKPRRPVAKIESFDHPHLFQQMRGAVNRGQVAPVRHGGANLLGRQRMRMLPQYLQYRLAGTGNVARLPSQPPGQRGHFLPL